MIASERGERIVAIHEPDDSSQDGGDLPPAPKNKERRLPVAWLIMTAALVALIALLALSY